MFKNPNVFFTPSTPSTPSKPSAPSTPDITRAKTCPPTPVKSYEREEQFQEIVKKFEFLTERGKRYNRYVERKNLQFIEQQEAENKVKGYSK